MSAAKGLFRAIVTFALCFSVVGAEDDYVSVEVRIKLRQFDEVKDAAQKNESEELLFNGQVSRGEFKLLTNIHKMIKSDLAKDLKDRKSNPALRADSAVGEQWIGSISWFAATHEKEAFLFNDAGRPVTFGFKGINDDDASSEFQKILFKLIIVEIGKRK